MAEVDLTPEDRTETVRKGSRSPRNILIMSVICLALGFVLFQALTNARIFFLNVDEAVAQQSELGDKRFRMQGTVTTVPDTKDDGSLFFAVAFNGEQADVRHIGDAPSALFECNTPVVIEGRWIENTFESELITVKHSEEYEEANEERLEEAYKPVGSSC